MNSYWVLTHSVHSVQEEMAWSAVHHFKLVIKGTQNSSGLPNILLFKVEYVYVSHVCLFCFHYVFVIWPIVFPLCLISYSVHICSIVLVINLSLVFVFIALVFLQFFVRSCLRFDVCFTQNNQPWQYDCSVLLKSHAWTLHTWTDDEF